MDNYKNIFDLIMQFGFPLVALVFVYKKLELSQAQLKDRLCNDIEDLKKENHEDKMMFNKAISMFEQAVNEFKANNTKMSNIETHVSQVDNKIGIVEKDIQDIKEKIK